VPEKRLRLRAVRGDVQSEVGVGIAKGFKRQPDIARTVLNQENVHRRERLFVSVHDFKPNVFSLYDGLILPK
jgi:hypothetical protein